MNKNMKKSFQPTFKKFYYFLNSILTEKQKIDLNNTFREIYDDGKKAGIKQEKRRQTIAYNKACDKFGI